MNLKDNTLLQGGKYKIVRFIGSGGFGCTYEAVHTMLDKRVAIKEFFVRDFCNRDEVTAHVSVGTQSKRPLVEKLKRKFVDEARALSRLSHPNIVRVSDVFEENGTAYYVMDYIDGQSLGDMSKERGALPEREAVKYIRQTAEALKYVHSRNRLHLDIKPGNILTDDNGNIVLIDFGASKQYDEEDGENTSTLMGKTPGYAPLEQMGNDVVEFLPATDIYALGATLYKLLTGVTPLAANLLAGGETLTPLPDAVSKNVREAVSAAMLSNKRKRPQSIDEFLAILDGKQKSSGRLESNNERTEIDGVEVVNAQPIKTAKSGGNILFPTWLKIAVAVACGAVIAVITGIAMSRQTNGNAVEEAKSVENAERTFGNTTFVYTGSVDDNGQPDGFGKGVYPDGAYEGHYSAGSREGDGVFTTADGGNTFKGTFKDDEYYEGTLTLADGSYFTGTFKNNYFDTGKWYTADGKFDGEMKNGDFIQ